jgi:uncharacterized protein
MTVAVIDTNLLVSALINPHGLPARVVRAWIERRAFTLATCEFQIDELRSVSKRPELSRFIRPPQAGRLINQLNALAMMAPEPLPQVDVLKDPFDNFLLACAQATGAHYIASGDKADVLSLPRFGSVRIATMREFANVLQMSE